MIPVAEFGNTMQSPSRQKTLRVRGMSQMADKPADAQHGNEE
jgi:hypothetical protein